MTESTDSKSSASSASSVFSLSPFLIYSIVPFIVVIYAYEIQQEKGMIIL